MITGMATFTTWTAAYNSMLDDLASGNTKVGSVGIGDKVLRYRSHDDFLQLLAFVEKRAKIEDGTLSLRVYAKQGGRCSS